MIILGLDPGLAILGYGVIEVLPGKKMRAVDYGCVFTEAHTPLPDRLMKISDGIAMLFETYRPDAVSMEELFLRKCENRNHGGAGKGRGTGRVREAYQGIV